MKLEIAIGRKLTPLRLGQNTQHVQRYRSPQFVQPVASSLDNGELQSEAEKHKILLSRHLSRGEFGKALTRASLNISAYYQLINQCLWFMSLHMG